jgi:uncharacterized protein (TIGR03435 family)
MKLLLLLIASALGAQTFEVASVKAALPRVGEAGFLKMTEGHGRLSYSNITMPVLVSFAYEIDTDRIQFKESWMDSNKYDLTATFAPNATKTDVHAMLRNLLTERFGLVVHKSSKDSSALELYPDPKGVRLKPAAEDAHGGLMTLRGRLIGDHMSMPTLASMLTRQVGQPVADKTGQAGEFNIDLKWKPDSAEESGDIYFALREQLGLRLRPSATKTTIETLVIDKANREPTEP